MPKIKCQMFGVPQISENNNIIYLPSGKVSSILYYILEKKTISRDELVAMFWPDSNEKNAKNSLRNVIFKIRSAFSSDIISTPNKSLILLNTKNINFDIDTHKLTENPQENYSLYIGDYLEGVSLKESVGFQYWVDEKREFYKSLVVKALCWDVETSLDEGIYDNLEQKMYKLISLDEFDEGSYKLLFEYLSAVERPDKIINEYHKVQNLFLNELGIEVGEEIKKIYEDSLDSVSSNNRKEANPQLDLIERQEESTVIKHIMQRFIEGENNQHIAIVGEKGIGKTYFSRSILNSFENEAIILRLICYRIENKVAYSAVRTLVHEINNLISSHDFNPGTEFSTGIYELENPGLDTFHNLFENSTNVNLTKLLNSIQGILKDISLKKKLIISIDDINNSDEYSLEFFTNLMLHLSDNVKFMITLENNNKKLDTVLGSLKSIKKIKIIELSNYNKSKVRDIVKNTLKLKKDVEKITEEIYEKSKGNPLFVNELINNYRSNNQILITEKIYDLLLEKFSVYSQDELDIMRLISLFYYPVSYDLILKLSKQDPFKVINSINILIKDGIIEELNEKEIQLRFYNSTYRDYIYGTLKESTRIMLHKTVANMLEDEIPKGYKSVKSMISIKNQYDRAKDAINSLRFEVYILDYHLSYTHEVFPTLEEFQQGDLNDSKLNSMNLNEVFKDISNRINILKSDIDSAESLENLIKVEQVYEFCKGRFLIRQGDYIEGVESINKALTLAKESDNWSLIIDSYKQLIIQGIQIDSPEVMIKSIVPAVRIAKKQNDYEELSILYRLFGLYRFMIGDLEEAKSLFENSIKLLDENLGFKNNSVNKAASYNYLGEIMYSEGKFSEAKLYFEKAINLCSYNNAISSSIFYLNLGRTNYFLGKFKEMKENFNSAGKYYEQYDLYWKRPVLDSFLALIAFRENNYEKTIELLKKAFTDGKLINNNRDLGIFYFVESLILDELKAKEIKDEHLWEYFNVSDKVYKFNALQYLDPVRDKYEIEYLQGMK